jgi:uncharacterized membrane protein YGL010W
VGAAALANNLLNKYDKTKVNSIALGVHVISWILQFVGHGKYEGRKPALLDNLVQALFLAPLFVWYEVLFKLGFYPQLKKDVEAAIEVEVAKLGKGKGKEEMIRDIGVGDGTAILQYGNFWSSPRWL